MNICYKYFETPGQHWENGESRRSINRSVTKTRRWGWITRHGQILGSPPTCRRHCEMKTISWLKQNGFRRHAKYFHKVLKPCYCFLGEGCIHHAISTLYEKLILFCFGRCDIDPFHGLSAAKVVACKHDDNMSQWGLHGVRQNTQTGKGNQRPLTCSLRKQAGSPLRLVCE